MPMYTTIRRIFSLKNSLAITIPSQIVRELRLRKEDLCVIKKTGRRSFEVVILKRISEVEDEVERIKQEG
jgi:antitoxin component of MazEF toxin-antitoxin module